MNFVNELVFLDLSAAVDVYADWIDACDAVAKDAARKDDQGASSRVQDSGRYGDLLLGIEREDDLGVIVDDDLNEGEGDYDD